MNAWQTFFSWPSGGIWSNILASLIWGTFGLLWARGHLKKIHKHNAYMALRMEQLHKKVKK